MSLTNNRATCLIVYATSLRVYCVVLVVDPALYRLRRTFRIVVHPVLESVPSALPEILEFFRRVHEEITVISFAPCGITVIPLAVQFDVVPEVGCCLIRPPLDDHVFDAGDIKQNLYGIHSRVAVAGTVNKRVIGRFRPGITVCL